MAQILIVDDEAGFSGMLATKLHSMGHAAVCCPTLQLGLAASRKEPFDIVYLDVHLPDGNGLEAISAFRATASAPEIIIITGHGDPDGAELAITNGAWDYFQKPTSLTTMVLPVLRALEYREAKLRHGSSAPLNRQGIVGTGPGIRACLDAVAKAAGSDARVLICGESGTGKELIAWAIHNNSSRAGKSFVIVDCASLTEPLAESVLFGHERGAYTGADRAREGLIRQADGGTLFLDEVSELPFSIQKLFLRILQEQRFRPLGGSVEVESDFRLLAATNRNLPGMVAEGSFREDLFHRIHSLSIEVPPLRERKEDIAELSLYFLGKISGRLRKEPLGISPEALYILGAYDWPGNIRELNQTIDRMAALAGNEGVLLPQHLPVPLRIATARASVSPGARDPERVNAPAARGVETGPERTSPTVSASLRRDDETATVPSWQEYRDGVLNRAEREYLQRLLGQSGGRVTRACKLSGLSRSRLYELLKKHGLSILQ